MSTTSPTGYDGMFVPPGEDPRRVGNPHGELATYREYLDFYRLTLRLKCDGLSPEQLATRSVPPSTLSLLGLVRHMAYVEHTWFRRFLQSRWDLPKLYSSPDDPDHEFNAAVGTAECVEDALDRWQAEIAAADAWLATQRDDTLAVELPFEDPAETASVRDVLVHLIEEYARHCGHADLLRECLDGRVGQ